MKPNIFFSFSLIVISMFVIAACNSEKTDEKKSDEKTTMDTTKSEPIPGFDPSMDATTISGYPARVLADSLGIKPYEFLAMPGDSIPLHMHPDHVIYVIEGGKARINPKGAESTVVDFPAGACFVFGPETHSAKNIGTTNLKLLIVHVYRPRS